MTAGPQLFSSIPKDVFQFFDGAQVRGQKVVDVLGFKKADVSVAANIAANSVRYDQRMPEELQRRLVEWATAINAVGAFFGDMDKTILWFQTPNPLLGNTPPREMIRVGRFKKLFSFIQTALIEGQGG